NGVEVVAGGDAERGWVEAFARADWLGAGIGLEPGARIVDAGAGEGFVSLAAALVSPGARVWAIESDDAARDRLACNLAFNGVDARVLGGSLAGRAGASVERSSESRTLSALLREEGIDRIDLLRLRLPGREREALGGLAARDWRRVRRVVVEAADGAAAEEVAVLLAERGLAVETGEIGGTAWVWARRPAATGEVSEARREALVRGLPPAESPALTGVALRAFAAANLPEYMIPSVFVLLPALPLGNTGKVDRRALPAPPPEPGGYLAPRTPDEGVIAAIWAEALGVDRVGVDDDFFALGGQSLLATQVVSRLRDAFGVEVPLRRLFEAPTVAALARSVARAREAGASSAERVTRAGRDRRLPLSFAQQRLWLIDRMEPGNAAYVVFSALPLPAGTEAAEVERALNEIVRRHEALRTTFAEAEGRAVQVIAPSLEIGLGVLDLAPLPPEQRPEAARRKVAEEASAPFDLERGPLLRATLLVDGGARRLLLAMHHIVSDAWSMGVIGRELAACLAAYAEGEEPRLPELPVQYADYAVWQRQLLQGEALERELEFWRARLEGAPEETALPADRPRPARRTHR
ncbi:MAG TPA: condensation domain-containing protein, partial [Longimicrobium sp.]|nr:condensation domain-containing protein [Longimicrobium sp.]